MFEQSGACKEHEEGHEGQNMLCEATTTSLMS